MIHKVYDLVSNIMSQFTTLFPGDLILNSAAAGTAKAMPPDDVVEIEISGIGVLCNPARAET